MPSNIERKARRKKQTRLTFDPVDRSSSPARMSAAKAHYSLPGQRSTPLSSMQPDPVEDTDDDILASSKKSSVKSSPASRSKNGKLPFKALPTPAKSSQMGKIGSFFGKAYLPLLLPIFKLPPIHLLLLCCFAPAPSQAYRYLVSRYRRGRRD